MPRSTVKNFLDFSTSSEREVDRENMEGICRIIKLVEYRFKVQITGEGGGGQCEQYFYLKPDVGAKASATELQLWNEADSFLMNYKKNSVETLTCISLKGQRHENFDLVFCVLKTLNIGPLQTGSSNLRSF